MKEFKVNEALRVMVDEVKAQGQSLVEGYETVDMSGVGTLSTAQGYAARCDSICSLMKEYAQLVQKDMQDVAEAITLAEEQDNAVARKIGKGQ